MDINWHKNGRDYIERFICEEDMVIKRHEDTTINPNFSITVNTNIGPKIIQRVFPIGFGNEILMDTNIKLGKRNPIVSREGDITVRTYFLSYNPVKLPSSLL